MNWSGFFSAMIGALPTLLVSLVMLYLTIEPDQSMEKLKTDLPRNAIQFTKWHEKRVQALTAMAQEISKYEEELQSFWHTVNRNLSTEGESARERIQQQLDYDIHLFLPRLKEDINQCLGPNFKVDEKNYRGLFAEWPYSKKST
jgi:hypothetical protein